MNFKIHFLFFLCIAASIGSARAQKIKDFQIGTAGNTIKIDGQPLEEAWKNAETITGFQRNFPDDSSLARYQTIVRLLYDETYLYVSAILYRDSLKKYSVSTLKEDFIFLENDAFGFIIDPFSDLTNGYGFYVNAYGVKRDEQIYNGNTADATMDIKWMAEVVRSAGRWSMEMAIPFRYVRFKKSGSWNVNFIRNDVGANERSAWMRTPINFLLGNLAFCGKMMWMNPPGRHGDSYSIIPSLTVSETRENRNPFSLTIQPSLDAKIALSSSLNMDVTINPDFSQAEVDKAQVNLTRFELVFPENRLFFTENSDLFAAFGHDSWGSPAVRPFYSRRIGLRYDSIISSYVPSSILGGIRVSGKLNKDLRLGLLSVLTEQKEIERMGYSSRARYSPAQNYSVISLQQKVFARSNFAFMLVNRQAFGNDSSDKFSLNSRDYNRTAALEYNYATANDKYSGKFFYHLLFDNDNTNTAFARGINFRHNTYRWRNWVQLVDISPGFQPEAGFVPRTDVFGINLQAAYSIYPRKGKYNRIEFVTNPQFFNRSDFGSADQFIISGLNFIGRNTSDLWLVHIYERVKLRSDFDPSFSKNGQKLDSGSTSMYNYFRLYYGSDKRRSFFGELLLDAGGYYNGRQLKLEGEFNYRLQPKGIIGIAYNFSRFDMPEAYPGNTIIYIGPKTDISFTRNIFFTSMVQYSNLSHNLNFYNRFQWRFKPLSDLFLIYSSNRNTELWEPRNQQLKLKLIWWM